MATFVHGHGSMHGGWCWKRVTPRLRATGHGAFTPTLTDLGERANLAHPVSDLEAHIQDVLGVLEYEDLLDQPLRMVNKAEFDGQKTFIAFGTVPVATWRDAMIERTRFERGWNFRELVTGHDAMIIAPNQMANLLLEIT